MPRYKNVNGSSGVRAYQIGDDHIIVQFVDGERYLYSYRMPGKRFVERMKKLAATGKGLSTYISQNVKNRYEKKL
jgi:hypothetical protein